MALPQAPNGINEIISKIPYRNAKLIFGSCYESIERLEGKTRKDLLLGFNLVK
jgi:hypothetical protein